MTARIILSVGTATAALVLATSASAQDYEYSQPADTSMALPPLTGAGSPADAGADYAQAGGDYAAYYEARGVAVDAEPSMQSQTVERVYRSYDAPQGYNTAAPRQHSAAPHSSHMAHSTHAAPHHASMPVPDGREAWLADCRKLYGSHGRGRRDGQAIGAVVGAAAGGLIGNRVAGDGDRLAGTLIGAGAGAIAGTAAGGAIGASNDRRKAMDYCESYLEQYLAGYHHRGAGYAHHAPAHHQGHACPQTCGYYYPQRYTMVEVQVPVQQRAIVRETVRTEIVEEVVYDEVVETVPVSTKRVRVAPRPVKSIKD